MSARSAGKLRRLIEAEVRSRIAWAAFEPNGPKLWSRVRRESGDFMRELFERGAFHGSTLKDAYFVQCGTKTMTRSDIDAGNLIVVIGFAEVRPAEFVILTIGQMVQGSKSNTKCKPS